MRLFTPTGILLFSLALTRPAFSADPHHHDHATEPAAVTLPQGKKWAADQHLKKNMADLEKAFQKVHKLHEKAKAKDKDFLGLSQQIQKSTTAIIKNCKLEPQADSSLHLILGQLGLAQNELKDATKLQVGLPRLKKALESYHEQFE